MSERLRTLRVLSAWRDGDRSKAVEDGALRALQRHGKGSGLPFEEDVLNPDLWLSREEMPPSVRSSLYLYNLEEGCYAFFALTHRPAPLIRGIALRANSSWTRLYVDVLGVSTVTYAYYTHPYMNPRRELRQAMLRKGARKYYEVIRERLERGWMAAYMEHEVRQLLHDFEGGKA